MLKQANYPLIFVLQKKYLYIFFQWMQSAQACKSKRMNLKWSEDCLCAISQSKTNLLILKNWKKEVTVKKEQENLSQSQNSQKYHEINRR